MTQRAPLKNFAEADVTFTGPLYGADKEAAYRLARLLVLPSYTENFGGVVSDALGFGLPVLASEATPWSVLHEEGCGETFALDEKALAEALGRFLMASDSELDEFGRRGRALALNRYAWRAIAQILVNMGV